MCVCVCIRGGRVYSGLIKEPVGGSCDFFFVVEDPDITYERY